MTFKLLNKLIEENDIPKNVKLMSDSGWECSETDMDGVYYNEKENILIFTQEGSCYDSWFNDNEYKLLYGHNKLCQDCKNLADHYCSVHRDDDVNYVGMIKDLSECQYFEKRDNNV